MKPWKKYGKVNTDTDVSFDQEKEVETPKVAPIVEKKEEITPESFSLMCAVCNSKATVIYSGTTYCLPCLKEQKRIGAI